MTRGRRRRGLRCGRLAPAAAHPAPFPAGEVNLTTTTTTKIRTESRCSLRRAREGEKPSKPERNLFFLRFASDVARAGPAPVRGARLWDLALGAGPARSWLPRSVAPVFPGLGQSSPESFGGDPLQVGVVSNEAAPALPASACGRRPWESWPGPFPGAPRAAPWTAALRRSPVPALLGRAPGARRPAGRGPRRPRNLAPRGGEGCGAPQVHPVLKESEMFSWETFPLCLLSPLSLLPLSPAPGWPSSVSSGSPVLLAPTPGPLPASLTGSPPLAICEAGPWGAGGRARGWPSGCGSVVTHCPLLAAQAQPYPSLPAQAVTALGCTWGRPAAGSVSPSHTLWAEPWAPLSPVGSPGWPLSGECRLGPCSSTASLGFAVGACYCSRPRRGCRGRCTVLKRLGPAPWWRS